MRCRDGSYSWVRDRGMVSVRDAAGKPLRMIGTLSDINGQMRALLQLRLLARLHAVLSESMAAMLHGATPEQLFQRICEVVVRQGGRVIGALTFYAAEVGWYDPEIRQLCEGLGAQISFALDKYAADAATAGRPAN